MPGQIKVNKEATAREILLKHAVEASFIAGGILLAVIAVGLGVWFGYSAPIGEVVEKSVAVLPFENLSADPADAFLAVGVQDEIRNDLAKVADLQVISRNSVMQYKPGVKRNLRGIADALGVAHVVEGSVQRAADRVRVRAAGWLALERPVLCPRPRPGRHLDGDRDLGRGRARGSGRGRRRGRTG